jgi:hypothetical protein
MKTSLFVAVLLTALAAPLAADRAEDDLQLVKKAVASSPAAAARPPAEEPPAASAEAKPQPRQGEPAWFRVRIVEKAGKSGTAGTARDKGARVSVSLPLGLVRSLGDEWPIGQPGHCRHDHHCPTLGEILRALDSGQSLVDIEDDETAVRVWVE